MPAIPLYHADMKEERRVFLVGDSLFNESLVQILDAAAGINIVGSAVIRELDLEVLSAARPHVIVLAAGGQSGQDTCASLLSQFPEIPVIHADLNRDYVQIITSRRVHARRTDLLAAIQEIARPSPGIHEGPSDR